MFAPTDHSGFVVTLVPQVPFHILTVQMPIVMVTGLSLPKLQGSQVQSRIMPPQA